MKTTIAVIGLFGVMAAGIAAAAWATPPEGGPPGQGDCSHGNSGQPCVTDPSTNGQDCDEHGQHGGVNEDHCLPPPTETVPTGTTPTETTPTTPCPDCGPGQQTSPTPTTPTGPRCPPGMTPTAGKDGQPGNDECEFPKTTTTAPPTPSVPATPAAATTTTTPTVTPPAAVVVVKPKPKPPARQPAAKPKPAPNAKPKPKPVTHKPGPHVCATLKDGTQRAWWKGGNGMKPGCYPIIKGSG